MMMMMVYMNRTMDREKMEPDVAKGMIYGASDALHSSYHVSYNMLLNMTRVEDADPENLLRASFHQYQVSYLSYLSYISVMSVDDDLVRVFKWLCTTTLIL